MLQILTPLNKVERVSRSIDPTTFVAAPGVWAQLQADESIINVVAGTNALVNKLVIGSSSSNIYESHDVDVGRVATMESFGVRCQVDSTGYYGSMTLGDLLCVSSLAGQLGKLVSSREAANGIYEIVARCEKIDTVGGFLTFKTISPMIVTITTHGTTGTTYEPTGGTIEPVL